MNDWLTVWSDAMQRTLLPMTIAVVVLWCIEFQMSFRFLFADCLAATRHRGQFVAPRGITNREQGIANRSGHSVTGSFEQHFWDRNVTAFQHRRSIRFIKRDNICDTGVFPLCQCGLMVVSVLGGGSRLAIGSFASSPRCTTITVASWESRKRSKTAANDLS